MNRWRFIETSGFDISSEMALDRELFEAFIQDSVALPILRIFRVKKGVSVGRSWPLISTFPPRGRGKMGNIPPLETVGNKRKISIFSSLPLFYFSKRSGEGEGGNEEVCVRPTGGGLVRHGNDLIYSVIARFDSFPTFHQVRRSYLSFHEVVQDAFKDLGIETRLFRCDDPKACKNSKSYSLGDCFQRPVPTDVGINGKKIAGAAQWRRQNAFLHQGSIQLLQGITFQALKAAFLKAFQSKFGIVWEEAQQVH